ncbi:hypothetical protein EOD41_12295 [Mucilaginibacter limnophilus]|uniref:Uncharacterized protein n=1 Tax=Mucilaginibacter limnophilus TaxID=1932778 RepID=A0A3S2UKC2_9SPHI|nr:hypothetical protein [Mucilaginibacter limnophilus]RVU00258.1 hypothetical protein EOD41_12295 [Mucilaginibacter limnophilus]
MLKKSGILTIILLYLSTVCGFALNIHYCGNKIASVKIASAAKKCYAGEPQKMKCCKDKQVDVKVKDAHQGQEVQSLFGKLFAIDLPALPFEDFLFSAQRALLEKFESRPPPQQPDPASKTPIFIQNRNLRR